MKITQIVPANQMLFENKADRAVVTGSYKLGQILDAKVLANSSQGQVSLRLGGSELVASTSVPLQQNAALSLKVIQLQPQLLLQVLSAPRYDPLHDAKLNMLPRQTSLAPLLAELIQKSSLNESKVNVSAQKSAAQLLVAALFGRSELKRPEALQRAIKESGVFLEAKMASPSGQQQGVQSNDLKLLLLRYLSALRASQQGSSDEKLSRPLASSALADGEILPPIKGRLPISHPVTPLKAHAKNLEIRPSGLDVIKKIEGALARLGLLQVATAEQIEEGQRIWQLEIPVRHGNSVETVSLSIEKEQREADADEKEKENWAVNLALELPQLGAFQSRINNDAQGISTTFWSNSTKTLSLLESRVTELRANFERIGLHLHKVNCRKGQQPSTAPTDSITPPHSPLIDLEI